jgi:RsiW-degrading membrane proteinase PrsW (M82 family)
MRVVATTVGLWLAVPVLVASVLGSSALRAGVRSYLACWLVLVAWFLLARTKTLRWSWVARLFVAGIPVAVATSLVSSALAASVGLDGSDSGVVIGIAGTVEELMKLTPLLVVCLVVPGRVRRFSTVDWLLAGVACGLGYQAAEDGVRRIVWSVAGGIDPLLTGGGDPWADPLSGFPHYRWSLLSGSADIGGHAVFPGHHVLTGLVAAAIGVAVATGGSPLRRAAAWLVPVLAALVAVASHIGFAATMANQLLFGDGDSEVPRPIYLIWKLTDRGRLVGPALLVAFLAAMMVDSARLRRAEPGLPPHPGGPLASVPGRWERIGRRLRRTETGAGAAVAVDGPGPALFGVTADTSASIGRDLVGVARAIRRPSGTEPTSDRWAATVEIERRRREMGASGSAGVASDRGLQVGALVVAAAATVVTVVAGRRMATGIGQFLAGPGSPALAGLLDGFSGWWGSLGLGSQIVVVAGVIALAALSAAVFGVPSGGPGRGRATLSIHRAARSAVELLLARVLPARAVPEGEVDLVGALLDDPERFGASYAPSGRRAVALRGAVDPAGRRAEVARLLATRGLVVGAWSGRPGDRARQPDLVVDGRRFDLLSPRTDDAQQLATVLEIRVVRGGATRFVLDLDRSAVDLQRLRAQLDRHPVAGLEQVLVVQGDHALRFFP